MQALPKSFHVEHTFLANACTPMSFATVLSRIIEQTLKGGFNSEARLSFGPCCVLIFRHRSLQIWIEVSFEGLSLKQEEVSKSLAFLLTQNSNCELSCGCADLSV